MRSRMRSCVRAYSVRVPKTIQIRDVPDDVYAGLVRRAGEDGVSVPELLRKEAERVAARPSMAAWLEQTRHGRSSSSTDEDVTAALDETRGPWPDAGR